MSLKMSLMVILAPKLMVMLIFMIFFLVGLTVKRSVKINLDRPPPSPQSGQSSKESVFPLGWPLVMVNGNIWRPFIEKQQSHGILQCPGCWKICSFLKEQPKHKKRRTWRLSEDTHKFLGWRPSLRGFGEASIIHNFPREGITEPSLSSNVSLDIPGECAVCTYVRGEMV